jgi:predicted GIY-YIG superfamily endonuclease
MSTHNDNTYYVYTLTDPRTNKIRYVGVTTNPQHRLRCHISGSKHGKYRAEWLLELKADGVKPEMNIVAQAENEADGLDLEKEWIENLSASGHDLVNGRKPAKSVKKERQPKITTTCDEDIANGEPVIDLGAAWEKWCNALT